MMNGKNKVYSVSAYRFGDRKAHSYQVGVFSKKMKAFKCADEHREYRGGKYECEVIEWTLDDVDTQKIIRKVDY